MAEDSVKEVGEKAQKQLNGLEKWLDDIFGKKSPVQLPKDVRDILVKIAPWLALAGGVIGLASSWGFWRAGHAVNRLVDWANQFSTALGGEVSASRLGIMWYVSLIAMVVQSVLMLAAFGGLKEQKKVGWNLLFYSSLVSALLAVAYLFTPGYGFVSFLGSLIGTAIGMFLLFQIRERYAK